MSDLTPLIREYVSLSVRKSIYLADDHILCVLNNYFQERYRRFYFREIQAVTIRRTIDGRATMLVWLLLAVGWALIMLAADAVHWFPWALTLVPLVLAARQLYRRGTCVCQIQTAVSVQDVPAVSDLRKAERFLAAIRPRIEQAQGGALPPAIPLNPL